MRRNDAEFKAEIYHRKDLHDRKIAKIRRSVTVAVSSLCVILIATVALFGVQNRPSEPDQSPSLEVRPPVQKPGSTDVVFGGGAPSSTTGISTGGGSSATRLPADTSDNIDKTTNSSTDKESCDGENPEQESRVTVNGRVVGEMSADTALAFLSCYISVPGYDAPIYTEPVPPTSDGSSADGPSVDGPGDSDGGWSYGIEITDGDKTFSYTLSAHCLAGEEEIVFLQTEQTEAVLTFFGLFVEK